MDGVRKIPMWQWEKWQWTETASPLKDEVIVTISGLYRLDGKTFQNFSLGKAVNL
jgi:hypothetical protein